MDNPDKLLPATFEREKSGLVWIETVDRDDGGLVYKIWLLTQPGSDRMLASIDGPTPGSICFHVAMENGTQRKFISLDGAKRYAHGEALGILSSEHANRAQRRKTKRMDRLSKT